MTLTIEIDTENAAFDGDDLGQELARILTKIAYDCSNGDVATDWRTVRDINGNTVGRWAHVGNS